jgi:hypothetical protein
MQFFATPTLAVAFPYMQELAELEYFDDLPSHEQRAVLSLYEDCVRRQLAFNGDGRTFLSKNPSFCGKLEAVVQKFPDAKIIYPRRDPMETIPSLLAMLGEVWKLTNFDEREVERASQAIIDGCIKDYYYASKILNTLPEDKFTIVEFEAFTANPADTVREIYQHFGWPITEEYNEWLMQESPAPDRSISKRRRTLEDFGFDSASVKAKMALASVQHQQR